MAVSQLTLDVAQYEALVGLARKGALYDGLLSLAKKDPRCRSIVDNAEAGAALDSNQVRSLESFLKEIEKGNGITRYFLAVRWQEAGVPLQAGTRFPETWPPTHSVTIEQFTRAIARADVDAILSARATNPQLVMVTLDPGLRLGWTPIDDYFTS